MWVVQAEIWVSIIKGGVYGMFEYFVLRILLFLGGSVNIQKLIYYQFFKFLQQHIYPFCSRQIPLRPLDAQP